MLPDTIGIEKFLSEKTGSLGLSADSRRSLSGTGKQDDPAAFLQEIQKLQKAWSDKTGAGDLQALARLEKFSGDSPRQLLAAVKQYLTEKGYSDQAFRLDAEALSAISRVFLAAGLKPDQVSGFFDKLREGQAEGSLLMSDFMAALSRPAELGPAPDDTVLLDASAEPYLQSILSALGLKPERVQEIMAQSKTAAGKIDTEQLAAALKSLAADQGRFSAKATGDPLVQQQLQQMMQKCGLAGSGQQMAGPVTLETLLARLEALSKSSQDGPPNLSPQETARQIEDILSQSRKAAQGPLNGGPVAENAAVATEKTAATASTAASAAAGQGVAVPSVGRQNASGENRSPSLDRLMENITTEKQESGQDKSELRQVLKKGLFFQNHQNKTDGRSADSRSSDLSSLSQEYFRSNGPVKSGTAGATAKAAKPLPNHVLNQMGRQIVKALQNNEKTLTFQLKPPDLGRIQISLETVNRQLRVHIVTEQAATRDILVSHKAELRQVVSDQQVLRLEKVDVQLADNFDRSMADARDERWQRQGQGQNQRRFSGQLPGGGGETPLAGGVGEGQMLSERPAALLGRVHLVV